MRLRNYGRLIEYQPTNFVGYQGLADIYGARENWEAVRTNLTRAISLRQTSTARNTSQALLVQLGDMEGYARRLVLTRMRPIQLLPERTAKEFLFIAPPDADLVTLSNLAETAIAAGDKSWLHFEFVKGLARPPPRTLAKRGSWEQRV